MLFVASVVYTLIFHGARIWIFLIVEKGAVMLGFIAIVKSLFLTFDILTNGLLFYKVLVFKGIHLFDPRGVVPLALSVAAASPLITLTTNGTFCLFNHVSTFEFSFTLFQLQTSFS